jgi:MFS family permease
MGMLLTALDSNIVATAVPTISSEFGQRKDSSWLGTGFLISFAPTLLIYAKLGDMFGRRNLFIAGTAVFIIGVDSAEGRGA